MFFQGNSEILKTDDHGMRGFFIHPSFYGFTIRYEKYGRL